MTTVTVVYPKPKVITVQSKGAQGPPGEPGAVVGGVPEAPSPDEDFVRREGSWNPVTVIPPVPLDDQTYGLQNNAWVPFSVLPPRPTDDRLYGIQNEAWTPIDTIEGPPGPAGADSTVPGPAGPPGAVGSPGTTTWAGITDKPLTYAPEPHGHTISDVNGLTPALAGKEPAVAASTSSYFWRGDKQWATPPMSLSTAEYTYSTTTTAPPASGQVRLNQANQTTVSQIYIHYVHAQGVDIRNALLLMASGNKILMQDKTDATKNQIYVVGGNPVDVPAQNYIAVPVQWEKGGASFTAGRVIFAVFGLGVSQTAPTILPASVEPDRVAALEARIAALEAR